MIDRKPAAVIVAAFCLVASIAAVPAEEATPDNDHGRYSFNKSGDEFVRLDQRTGEVSVCSQRTVGWACQTAPDDRTVLESEISRLRTENVALKKELLANNLPLPSGVAPEPPAAHDGDHGPQLSDNSDIDRMVAIAGRLWHRFVEAIARAQKQVLNKT